MGTCCQFPCALRASTGHWNSITGILYGNPGMYDRYQRSSSLATSHQEPGGAQSKQWPGNFLCPSFWLATKLRSPLCPPCAVSPALATCCSYLAHPKTERLWENQLVCVMSLSSSLLNVHRCPVLDPKASGAGTGQCASLGSWFWKACRLQITRMPNSGRKEATWEASSGLVVAISTQSTVRLRPFESRQSLIFHQLIQE